MEGYIETLLNMEERCRFFKENMLRLFYTNPQMVQYIKTMRICYEPAYQDLLRPLKGVSEVIEVFGIEMLEKNKKALQSVLRLLEDPNLMWKQELFQEKINSVIEVFSKKRVKKEIQNRLLLLNREEISRLNEAIHCFLEDCNYSAVAMSVSAIEFRLLSLMTSTCQNARLERMTLGQLINEYLNNKDKYRRIIPEKHEPLLEHCNTYRIFSVHPKKERINKSVATSILHMTFQFLLDKDLVHG